jgi:hypothetical protein
MLPSPRSGHVKGNCANPQCGKEVYEPLVLLDDAYLVWVGKCPFCGTLHFLDFSKGCRGYSSKGMQLCLPTREEVRINLLPPDTLTKEDIAG